MSDIFVLPDTAAEADKLANELGELVTAHEWQRASLVFARVQVRDGPGRPSAEMANSDHFLTPREMPRSASSA